MSIYLKCNVIKVSVDVKVKCPNTFVYIVYNGELTTSEKICKTDQTMQKQHVTLQNLTIMSSNVLEMLIQNGKRERRYAIMSSLVYSAKLREYEGIVYCGCNHCNPHIPSPRESQQPRLTCTQTNSGIKDMAATLDCISAVTLNLWRTFSQLKLKKGPNRPCSL